MRVVRKVKGRRGREVDYNGRVSTNRDRQDVRDGCGTREGVKLKCGKKERKTLLWLKKVRGREGRNEV